MTIERPAPLVPIEADLRGYDYMPFYGAWLRSSMFNAECSDAEYRAAVNLWWSAWHELPAGSLPDNEAALCKAADLGRDRRKFAKLRKVAMSGFVMCSDGRWYHEFICVQVRIQWQERLNAIRRGINSGAARRLKSNGKHSQDNIETESKALANALETELNKGREVKSTTSTFVDRTSNSRPVDKPSEVNPTSTPPTSAYNPYAGTTAGRDQAEARVERTQARIADQRTAAAQVAPIPEHIRDKFVKRHNPEEPINSPAEEPTP